MNKAEIVRAAINHQSTPKVPHTLGFDGDMAERLDRHYGNQAWRQRINGYIGWSAVLNNLNMRPTDRPGLSQDTYGTIWCTDSSAFHVEKPALPQPSFTGYTWPKPEAFFYDAKGAAEQQVKCKSLKGEQYLLGGAGWGLFESSWGMCGFEAALSYMLEEPEFYEELLDRLTEQFIAYVHHTCRTLPEIDAMMFGDDWGEQRGVIMGPERWRQLFKPRYRRIYDTVHGYGKKVITHCCGSVVDIMPDLIEIGLDVLESVQPETRGMNPYVLKQRFGDRLCFWGGLGSQSTVAFGTPQAIKTEIEKLRREMGQGGGYILAPAKSLQPGMPLENAVAVVEAFAE